MKLSFLPGIVLGIILNTNAQTITIKDQETKNPLDLVALISENPRATAISNADGQADISAFKGSNTIQIRSLGYKTTRMSYAELESVNFIIFLIPSNLNLDEVTVAATRWQQVSDNIPSRIIAVSPAEVAFQNPQTAADLLGISGEVFVQKSQQAGGSPMIRGFATNRLLYAVDGVRMNTAIFRGGNLQNVINLDPFAIENTEVLFGPGSVIYGSDAIGGVMSFTSLKPQFSLNEKILVTGKVTSRYSSANNEKTGHADINIGWKKWAFISSFSHWDFDNLKQGSHGPKDYVKPYYVQRQHDADIIINQYDPLLQIPSAYTQFNTMQKVRFKPDDKWDFQYGFHYSGTSAYGRYDRHNRMRNGLPRYAEWNYGPQIWIMNNLSMIHKGDGILFDQMAVRLAQQYFEESRIDRPLNNYNRSTQTEHVKAYSINLDLTRNLKTNQTLYYGTEFVTDAVSSEGSITDITDNTGREGPSRYPKATWSSLAIYAENELKLNGKTTFLAGLRYNYYRLKANFTNNLPYYPFSFTKTTIGNGALTGSLGAVYRPDKSLVISTNMSTAFRSPNVDDMGKVFDSEPGAVTVPNPGLKAEFAYNIDLGIAKIFGDVLKLDISCYYTKLRNAIVRRDFKLNGQDSILYNGELSKVQAIQNAAVAHVYGIQAGLEAKLPAGFSISADLNFQQGEEELEDGTTSTLRHASPIYGVARLNYKVDKLSVQLNVDYQAERSFEDLPVEERSKDEIYAKDKNGNNYAPSWYTLNLKTMYAFSDVFSIHAGIENITDQRYRPYSSGISGAGRNFVLSVTAKF